MKRIICLWGGPGTGKSTSCAGLFNFLKKLDFNCEMNREYIKDWVWEDRKLLDGDQIYITAKQARKERIYMREGLDFIITDSPLALTTFYGHKYDKYEREFDACKHIVKQHHQFCKDYGYKVDHYFLTRTKKYQPVGRTQTEDEAKRIDDEIRIFLQEYPINFIKIACDENIEANIINRYLDKVERI